MCKPSESSEKKNEHVLRTLHLAWSKAQLNEMLACVTSDLTYWTNIGDDGKPLVLTGRQQFRNFMETILADFECRSTLRDVRWLDGKAHASIAHSVRHRESGHALRGTFRQIATFRSDKIESLEEYYDAAKLHAFMRLVNAV